MANVNNEKIVLETTIQTLQKDIIALQNDNVAWLAVKAQYEQNKELTDIRHEKLLEQVWL